MHFAFLTFWNHFGYYPINSMKCNSILADHNLWENGKTNFLSKEEKRGSLNCLGPTKNSTFTKLLNSVVVTFVQAEEFPWLTLSVLEIIGASSLNEHLSDHESAMGRVLLMLLFTWQQLPWMWGYPKHLLLKRGTERREQLLDQGPWPLSFGQCKNSAGFCMLGTNRSPSLSGCFLGFFR